MDTGNMSDKKVIARQLVPYDPRFAGDIVTVSWSKEKFILLPEGSTVEDQIAKSTPLKVD